jgi:hypothetical protein
MREWSVVLLRNLVDGGIANKERINAVLNNNVDLS